MICPCLGCMERTEGCHSLCGRYNEYRKSYEVLRELQRRGRTTRDYCADYAAKQQKAARKYKK